MPAQTRRVILPAFLFLRTVLALPPSQACRDAIAAADADGDGVLQPREYTALVALLSEGDVDARDYARLPFALRWNFAALSCGLLPPFGNCISDGACCEGPDGGIDVAVKGAPGESPGAYLRMVCAKTQGEIDSARERGDNGGKPMAEVEPMSGLNKSPTDSPSNKPTLPPTPSPEMPPVIWTGPRNSPTPSPTTVEITPPIAESLTSTLMNNPTQRPMAVDPTISHVGSPISQLATEIPSAIPPTTPTASTKNPISGTETPTTKATAPTTSPNEILYTSSQSPPNNADAVVPLPLADTKSISPPSPGDSGEVEKAGREVRGDRNTSWEPLALGGVLGIASMTFVFSLCWVHVTWQKQNRNDDSELETHERKSLDSVEVEQSPETPVEAEQSPETPGDAIYQNRNEGGVCRLGVLASISEERTDFENDSEFRCKALCLPERNEESDSSSVVSDSGWSSSAGLSSLRSDDLDAEELLRNELEPGSFARACASTLTRSNQAGVDGSPCKAPKIFNSSVTFLPQQPPYPRGMVEIV